MARVAQSYNRGRSFRDPRPTVLIVCEDTKSSKSYIEDAALHFRVRAKVEVIHCGKTDPSGIISHAIQNKSKFDRVFCVIDRDSHANWDVAVQQGNAHITVISSYPCFEYWLILHFKYSRKPYSATGPKSSGDKCLDDLRAIKSMEAYQKGATTSIFGALINDLPTACANSIRALKDAESTGEHNPSTRFHEVIEFFKVLGDELN